MYILFYGVKCMRSVNEGDLAQCWWALAHPACRCLACGENPPDGSIRYLGLEHGMSLTWGGSYPNQSTGNSELGLYLKHTGKAGFRQLSSGYLEVSLSARNTLPAVLFWSWMLFTSYSVFLLSRPKNQKVCTVLPHDKCELMGGKLFFCWGVYRGERAGIEAVGVE